MDVNAQNRCCTRYCGNNNLNIPWEAIKVGTDPLRSAYIWRFSAYQTGNLTAVRNTNVTLVPGDYLWIQNNAGTEGSSPSTAYKIRVESAMGGSPYDFWLVPSSLPAALTAGARTNPPASSGLLPVTGQNFQYPVDRTGSWLVKVQGFNNPTSPTFWLDWNASTPTDNYAEITMNSVIPNPAPTVEITVGRLNWTDGLIGGTVTTLGPVAGTPQLQAIKIQLDNQVNFNNPTTYGVQIDKNRSNPWMSAQSWNNANLGATQVSTTEQLQNVNRKFFNLANTWVLYEVRVGNASIQGPQYAIVVGNPRLIIKRILLLQIGLVSWACSWTQPITTTVFRRP